ncbi:DUF4262 domain-containing protein [Sphingobium chungbukense]|uniref:DUF4262 domain-containing protein n=1 Tax=Sphingobium chungbukense TaxID=56193 RepID=A0A0M3AMW0_9SPHN|nr:DUF4262 domain-containing protein [Sphingobium chungbukense]KKW90266.1 hypothetical protein YP76_19850 [Sphingobium chungbukense]
MPPTDFYAVIEDNIRHDGQHLQAVFSDEAGPGFVYTIGNALQGLPELLILGNFNPRAVGPILNLLGDMMRDAKTPLEGDIDFGARFPVRVRRASAAARTRYTIQVGRYLRHEEYEVLQLLLCDPAGIYPGEPGCGSGFDVPLI